MNSRLKSLVAVAFFLCVVNVASRFAESREASEPLTFSGQPAIVESDPTLDVPGTLPNPTPNQQEVPGTLPNQGGQMQFDFVISQ